MAEARGWGRQVLGEVSGLGQSEGGGKKSREVIIGKWLEVDIKLTTRPAEYDRGKMEGQVGKGQEIFQGRSCHGWIDLKETNECSEAVR